jgi:hypothetical protein
VRCYRMHNRCRALASSDGTGSTFDAGIATYRNNFTIGGAIRITLAATNVTDVSDVEVSCNVFATSHMTISGGDSVPVAPESPQRRKHAQGGSGVLVEQARCTRTGPTQHLPRRSKSQRYRSPHALPSKSPLPLRAPAVPTPHTPASAPRTNPQHDTRGFAQSGKPQRARSITQRAITARQPGALPAAPA